jgi:hypothetical protein
MWRESINPIDNLVEQRRFRLVDTVDDLVTGLTQSVDNSTEKIWQLYYIIL